MSSVEVNWDGLVGPTHHFGGMGVGNVASLAHGGQIARPQAAALEGIQKMRVVASCGALQYVLPPQPRPDLRFLKRLGFRGTSAEVLSEAARESPAMLSAAWSASAMWTANAATVTAAADAGDGRTHLSVANLTSSIHRRLEVRPTLRLLRKIFPAPEFLVHPPLPPSWGLRDEGAANHLRLCDPSGDSGIELYVYGERNTTGQQPKEASRFPARQSWEASRALARRHHSKHAFFLQQHPRAIALGAFHNDVVSTSCREVLLMHEQAFADPQQLDAVAEAYRRHCGQSLWLSVVTEQELSLEETIRSYLFNCQLLVDATDPAGAMTIVCPQQVAESVAAKRVVDRWIADAGPISQAVYVELRESMNNGGGPACLRLRVPMSETQQQALPDQLRFCEPLADALQEVIEQTYPASLSLEDLTDASVLQRVSAAHAAVAGLLSIPLR